MKYVLILSILFTSSAFAYGDELYTRKEAAEQHDSYQDIQKPSEKYEQAIRDARNSYTR